jgi:hypothetical protein
VQLGRVAAAHAQLHDLLVQQRRLQSGDAVSLSEDLGGQRPVAPLECIEQSGLARHRPPGRARERHDLGVPQADPVQEADPLEQVGETVRGQDHRHQVGPALLVVGDEVGGQRVGRSLQPVLEKNQVVARADQRALNPAQLSLARGKRPLQHGQAPIRVGQAMSGRPDPRRFAGDLRAQRGGRGLAGADLALEIAGARRGQSTPEQQCRHNQTGGEAGAMTGVGQEHEGTGQHHDANRTPK